MERREYKLTEEQLNRLNMAAKPVRFLCITGVDPGSPQEKSNTVWRELGEEMGFDYCTVQPIKDKGDEYFTAKPTA